MTGKLSKRHFWKWFECNNKEYLQLGMKSKKDTIYWVNELRAHLRAYFKFLDFTLIPMQEGQSGILTISVNGAARRFKRVEAFVAAAPSIANWKIQALEEPMPMDFLLEERCGETGINPYEFRFLPQEEDDSIDLCVYHPLYTEERQSVFVQVAEAATYNLLGERSFGLDIRYISVDNVSCAPKEAELLNPEELERYLGGQKSSLVVDASGRMVLV